MQSAGYCADLEIQISSITSIGFKKQWFGNGYIFFRYTGGGEIDMTNLNYVPNVVFWQGNGKAFEELKLAIERQIALLHSPHARHVRIPDAIEELADMRARGILHLNRSSK